MRASATSTISPSAALHAPQTSNANKADDTSPFAQLLNVVGTTSQKDASKNASGDKARDDKAQGDKAQSHATDAKDVKTGAAQTQVRPRHTRTDKDDTKSETAKSTAQPTVDSSTNPPENIKPVVPPQALPAPFSTATEAPAGDDIGTLETNNSSAPPPVQSAPGKPDGQVASADTPAGGKTAANQDGAAAPVPPAPISPTSVPPGPATTPVASAPETGHIKNSGTQDTGTSASSKPTKSTKPDDQAKDGDTYNSGLTTADLQLVSQQFLQPAQGPAPQPATPAATDTDELETIAASSAAALPASAAAAPSAAATPSANTTAPQGSNSRRTAQAAAQSAASVQTDSDQAQDAIAATKADIAALKTQSGAAAHKTQPAANGTTDASKADENKTGDFKIAGTDGKPDTKTDAGTKSDPNQPVAPQTVVDQSQPRPAPAQPVNTNFTVHDITASQAVQPGTSPVAAAQVEQHVRVSTPQPDLPALAVQIATKSQGGARQFDIRLDPPELGHVDVRLSIDATGKASAHVTADQPQTLELLQKDASTLTRALRDAGLDVSQNGLNFSLRQQNSNGFGGDNSGSGGRSPSRGALSLQASRSIEAVGNSISYRAPADGRVDISV